MQDHIKALHPQPGNRSHVPILDAHALGDFLGSWQAGGQAEQGSRPANEPCQDRIEGDDQLPLGGEPACPNPSHSCFARGEAGCADVVCCNAVCNMDPFCCVTEWDGPCVVKAGDLCSPCASVAAISVCPPWSINENEPCGGSFVNNGCPGPIGSVTVGQTLCGTLWKLAGQPGDQDWFAFDVEEDQTSVSLNVDADFSVTVLLIDIGTPPSCSEPLIIKDFEIGACVSLSAMLDTGTYVITIAGSGSSLPCGANNDYVATLSQSPRLYISNGTGGGDWHSTATWRSYPTLQPVSTIPGEERDYDFVRIRSGDVVTQGLAYDHTLGYYLLEGGHVLESNGSTTSIADAVHSFSGSAGIRSLVVEAYGKLVPPGQAEPKDEYFAVLEIWNAAQYSYGHANVDAARLCDPQFCELVNNAPNGYFGYLKPCVFDDCNDSSTCGDGFCDPGEELTCPADCPAPFANQSTHLAITEIAVDNAACKLHEHLVQNLKMPLGIDTLVFSTAILDGLGRSVVEWIRQGAFLEDVPAYGTRRHFYDPIGDKGLLDYFDPAPEWALDGSSNQWSYVAFCDSYKQALTAPSPSDRENTFGFALRSVGHILHLLEDMGSVAHTRDDTHIFSYPFEAWAHTNYGTTSHFVSGLPGTIVSACPPPFACAPPRFSNAEPPPDISGFKGFWDRDQWEGQSVADPFATTPGLAEFINFNFFSEDTPFEQVPMWTPRPNVSDTNLLAQLFPGGTHPTLRFDTYHRKSALRWVADSDIGPTKRWQVISKISTGLHVPVVERVCVARVTGKIPPSTAISTSSPIVVEVSVPNESVYDNYASIILPKVIAYATGLVNHMFRGRVNVQIECSSDLCALMITNVSGMSVGPGTWELYVDSAAGTRTQVESYRQSGTFDSGESLTIEFEEPEIVEGPYTLVFDGTIGDDADMHARRGIIGKVFDAFDIIGDINRDGVVDGADLGLLLGAWGTDDPAADLNGDGAVDGADLGVILSSWS